MRKCWSHSPEDRPSFRVLKEQLLTISQGLLADWLPATRNSASSHDNTPVRETSSKYREEIHSHDIPNVNSKQPVLKHKEESHSHDTLVSHSKQTIQKFKEESYSHDTLLPNPKHQLPKYKEDTHLLNMIQTNSKELKHKDDCQTLDTLSRSHRETLLRLLKQYSNESVMLRELVTHCLTEKSNVSKVNQSGQSPASSKIIDSPSIPQSQSPPRTTLPRTKKNSNVVKESCDVCISSSRQPPWLIDICKLIAENAKKKWYLS